MQYSFSVFSNADIGLDPYTFSEGSFTIANAPRSLVIEDDDGILSDEAGEVQDGSTVFQAGQEMLDLNSQLVVGDIDGLGADGHIAQSVYRFTVTNATTGETGTAYMLRLYNDTDPSGFQASWGGGQLGPYYYAMDIAFSQGDQITLSNGNWIGQTRYSDLTGPSLICFAIGTRIATPTGDEPIERLRPGMVLRTITGGGSGTAVLRWIGMQRISGLQLAADPRLRPVDIAPGALGAGLPRRRLRLSQQHRLLIRSEVARRMTGQPEVLVAACHLIGLPGITRSANTDSVVYAHLLCDRHEVVLAEDAPCETLLPGAEAQKRLPAAARAEMARLFPEGPGAAARPLMAGRLARRLAARHLRNAKPLLAGLTEP